MSLSPADQRERADIIRRVGAYTARMGTTAHQYIKNIETQCQASNLESQRCYIFLNTVENNDIEEWFWDLDKEIIRNNWEVVEG